MESRSINTKSLELQQHREVLVAMETGSVSLEPKAPADTRELPAGLGRARPEQTKGQEQ